MELMTAIFLIIFILSLYWTINSYYADLVCVFLLAPSFVLFILCGLFTFNLVLEYRYGGTVQIIVDGENKGAHRRGCMTVKEYGFDRLEVTTYKNNSYRCIFVVKDVFISRNIKLNPTN